MKILQLGYIWWVAANREMRRARDCRRLLNSVNAQDQLYSSGGHYAFVSLCKWCRWWSRGPSI